MAWKTLCAYTPQKPSPKTLYDILFDKHMKRSLLLILLLINSSFIFAQKFKLNELLSLNEMNISEYDTYVTKKGYEFYKRESKENFEKYNYNEYYYTYNRTSYISKAYFFNLKRKKISYQTSNKNEYKRIKNDIIELGYKFTHTETTDLATFLEYRKNDSRIAIALIIAKNSLGYLENVYEITVENNL